jgi:hypothetical protein
MKRFLFVSIIAFALLLGSSGYACTGFCISQDDLALVGNNEDWKNPNTKVWYVPAEDGKYGRVYFGFDNFYPQGGMNEKGLVFDGFATSPNKVKKSLDQPTFGANLMDKIMSECATVDETLEIFDKYNLKFMERAMFFIADEHGDSAIIEGDEVVRKKGKYQVCTNFYQSRVKRKNEIRCGRYKIADAMLRDADDTSVDLCKRVLAATHQEGSNPTLYSNVYDLKRRVVYLYHFHNFQNEVVIDLKAELAKGPRRLDLPDLFPRTYVAESFRDAKTRDVEERKAKFTHKVTADILDSYAGRYRLDAAEDDKTIITITAASGKIFAQVEGQDKSELLPVSDSEFMHIDPNQTVKVAFVKGSNDKVAKMRIDAEGQTYFANRIR